MTNSWKQGRYQSRGGAFQNPFMHAEVIKNVCGWFHLVCWENVQLYICGCPASSSGFRTRIMSWNSRSLGALHSNMERSLGTQVLFLSYRTWNLLRSDMKPSKLGKIIAKTNQESFEGSFLFAFLLRKRSMVRMSHESSSTSLSLGSLDAKR